MWGIARVAVRYRAGTHFFDMHSPDSHHAEVCLRSRMCDGRLAMIVDV